MPGDGRARARLLPSVPDGTLVGRDVYTTPDLSRLEAAWLDYVQKRRELPIAQWAHDGDIKFAREAVSRYEFGAVLHIVAARVLMLDRRYEASVDKVTRQGKNSSRNKECEIAWHVAYEMKQVLRELLRNELPECLRQKDLDYANALVRKARESGV